MYKQNNRAIRRAVTPIVEALEQRAFRNGALSAIDDSVVLRNGGNAVNLGVLANDTTTGSAPLHIVAVTQPSNGSVQIASGSADHLLYTPSAGFTGSVTFAYTADDADGNEGTASVSVNVLAGGGASISAGDLAGSQRYATDGGFVVGADSDFSHTAAGNYSYSVTTPSSSAMVLWTDANGAENDKTTTKSETLTISSTDAGNGSWTYSESTTFLTTIVITPVISGLGTAQTETIEDDDLLVAAGDAAHSIYTFTAAETDGVIGSSSGAVDLAWNSSGHKSTTITNSADLSTNTSTGTSIQDGVYAYSSSGNGSYTYATTGGAVNGLNEQSSSLSDTFHYVGNDGSYVEQESNGYSYSGSGDYSDVNSAGTISEGGFGHSSSGYTINSEYVGGDWVKTGSSYNTDSSGGSLSSTGAGTYTRGSTTATNTSSVSGSTGVTQTSSWDTEGDTAQTLGTDGQWATSAGSGDSTGSSTDNWNYAGSGSYADTSSNGSAGSVHEQGVKNSETSYSVHSEWVGGSWVATGTNTADTLDQGSWGSSGTGTFTHSTSSANGNSSVTGNKNVSQESDWGTSSSATQTMGSDGTWTTSAGDGDSTGLTKDDWSYSGNGSYTSNTYNAGSLTGSMTGSYANSDGSNGTISEDGTNGSTNSYSIHSDWAGGSWVQAGNNTGTTLDAGHWTSTGTGNYTHTTTGSTGSSSVSGTSGATNSSEWDTHGNINSTLGANGSWTTSAGDSQSTGTTKDDWSYGGHGTSSAAGTHGIINEDGKNGSTNSYSIHSSWTGGSWTQTGTDTGTTLDGGHWTSSGSGSYTHATTSATASSSVSGSSAATSTKNWDTHGGVTSSLDSNGSWATASGHSDSTGTAVDAWTYGGSGTYSDSATHSGTLTTTGGGSYSNTDTGGGSIHEDGTSGSSSSYSLHSEWAGGTWVDSGTDNGTSFDKGHWTSSGTGSYTHTTNGPSGNSSVTGTSGKTHGTQWDTDGSVGQTLGSDGSWSTISGNTTSTTTTKDDWSYGGSGSQSGSGSPATITEGGTNGSTSDYSVNSSWSDGAWTPSGTDTETTLDNGHWTSSGSGTYNDSNASWVSGSTGATHGLDWGYNGLAVSTIDSDGSWAIASGSGDSTGSTKDDSSYVGSGSNSTSTGSSSITEDGTNGSTNSYSVHSSWDDGSWAQTGSETATTLDKGHWTSSGSGTYTDSNASWVTGSTGATHGTEWDTNGSVTSTLGDEGTWSVDSGSDNSSGTTKDDWSYSGSGSSPASGTSGSTDEGATNGATTTYNLHSEWSDGSWVETGTNTATTLDKGHWSSSNTGSYTHSNVSGSTGVASSKDWDQHGGVTSTFGDDHSWSISSGSGDSTGSTKDDWSYGGSGTYNDGGNVGTTNEDGTTGSTSSYSIHAEWESGAWTKTGTKTDSTSDHGHVSSSGTGNYVHAISGGSVAGSSGVNHSKDWSSGSTWIQGWDAGSSGWTTSSRTSDSTATQLDSTSASDNGSYTSSPGGIPVTGTVQESNDGFTSLSYSTSGAWDATNGFVVTGSGKGDRESSDSFIYSGSGSTSTNNPTGSPDGSWSETLTSDGSYSESGGHHHSAGVITDWVLDPNGHWRAASSTGTEDGDTSGGYSYSSEHASVYSDAWSQSSDDSSTSGNESFSYAFHRQATSTLSDTGVSGLSGSGTGQGKSTGNWKVRVRSNYSNASISISAFKASQDNSNSSSSWSASYNASGPTGSAQTTNAVDGSTETHNTFSYRPSEDSSTPYSQTIGSTGFAPGTGGSAMSGWAYNAPNLGYGGSPDAGAVGPAPDQIGYAIYNPYAPAKLALATSAAPADTVPATPASPRRPVDPALQNITDLQNRAAFDKANGGANQDYFNAAIHDAKHAYLHSGDATTWDYTKAIAGGAAQGAAQGALNAVNGVQDVVIGTANVGIKFSGVGIVASVTGHDLTIPSPDWSKGLVATEPDWAHNTSKFLGGQGIVLIATAGLSLAGEAGEVGDAAETCGTKIECFVAGTDVLLGDGNTEEQIQNIHVGERVATDGGVANSADGKTKSSDENATQVDPKTWRLITIDSADGNWKVQTLEPESWIESHAIVSGHVIQLSDIVDLKEMGTPDGIYGTVESIVACPSIETGTGRVVLTTVNHLNDNVFHLALTDADGKAETIGVTGYHKIYTRDRGWISAEDLLDGEQLEGDHGDLTVTGIARNPGLFRVYNLTVEDDHVYYVGDLTALVHNTGCGLSSLGEVTDDMIDNVNAIHEELDTVAARMRTTAIIRGVNEAGDTLDVVASSEETLEAAQFAAARSRGLLAAEGAAGEHAELKAISTLEFLGYRITAAVASREFCIEQCFPALMRAMSP